MEPLPILLWDVMSTLVTEPFFETVPSFFDMTLEQLFEVKDPTAWIEFEHGAIDEATYLGRFFKDGRPVDGEAFKRAMYEAYEWMPGVPDLLARLSAADYRMYALSNYSPWYRLIEDKLGLSRHLRWDFVSCETGLRKPDPEAYRHAARTLGVPAGRCVFIDDREDNVAAARTEGMQGILRTPDFGRLCDDLRACGVALSA